MAAPLITPRRLTVDEYHRMGRLGILCPDERVELIDGMLVQMAAIGSKHFAYVNRLTRQFILAVGARAIVSTQNPVRMTQYTEPQPDIVLLRPREDEYFDALPSPGDTLLVIEVADSSLAYDRRVKLPFYAAGGIPEVWIINVRRTALETHRTPRDGRYQETATLRPGESITLAALPDVTLAVADLLFQKRGR